MAGPVRPVTAAIALIASAATLVLGGSALDATVLGMPVGNLVAALAILALAYLPVALSTNGSRLRMVALAICALASSWLPVSVFLAGNTALNFTGAAGPMWLAGTLVVVLLALVALMCALLQTWVGGMRRRARLTNEERP